MKGLKSEREMMRDLPLAAHASHDESLLCSLYTPTAASCQVSGMVVDVEAREWWPADDVNDDRRNRASMRRRHIYALLLSLLIFPDESGFQAPLGQHARPGPNAAEGARCIMAGGNVNVGPHAMGPQSMVCLHRLHKTLGFLVVSRVL